MESITRKRETKEIDEDEVEIRGRVRVFWTPISRSILMDTVEKLLDYFDIRYSDSLADVPEDLLEKLEEKKILEWNDFYKAWGRGENYSNGNRVRVDGNKYILIFGDEGDGVDFIVVELRDKYEEKILEDIIKALESFESALIKNFF